uniref:Uncharacterized protein n=1 Tax=Cannabis sativa TaxID=3483 RepID=A0A803QRC9_CANSA
RSSGPKWVLNPHRLGFVQWWSQDPDPKLRVPLWLSLRDHGFLGVQVQVWVGPRTVPESRQTGGVFRPDYTNLSQRYWIIIGSDAVAVG